MSALVLTVLICLAWAGITAFGYIRGGWREIITLAAILLAYAVVSEWAASNGRDLAGVFGGNTYRSTTTIALAYLFGGTLLFGYLGGSRLPRPVPLSATERFVGGAVGLLNGGLLVALTLRILRAYTFGPGDGQVLQDAALARLLIVDIGYVLLVGLIAAMIAPFLSSLLVRPPQYAAQYEEDPTLQQAPSLGYFPAPDAPQPQPAYAPPVHPVPAPVIARAEPVPLSPSAPVIPAAVALVPTAPSLPRAVPAPLWPTPGLPTMVAVATNGTSGAEVVMPRPVPTVTSATPAARTSLESARSGPPGSGAASPSPTAGDATRAAAPAVPPSSPTTIPVTATPASLPAPSLPAFITGPAPFTARAAPTGTPLAMTEADATPFILAPMVSPPVGEQVEKPPVLPTAADAPRAATDTVLSPPEPLPALRELVPTAPVLPRAQEMPQAIPLTTSPDASIDSEERFSPGRAGVVTPGVTVSNAAPQPGQPAPGMHPCLVCEHPVRNGARFCPNCGSVQPSA